MVVTIVIDTQIPIKIFIILHHSAPPKCKSQAEKKAKTKSSSLLGHTVRNLHFLVQKFNFDFPRKFVESFWEKTRENAAVLDFLAIDNLDFTRKIVKKVLGEKLVKMLGFWIFQLLTALISRKKKNVKKNTGEKFVKM